MPRSRSRSMESSTWARIDRGSTVWVISRMRSASVALPWSMWAMIAKLRRGAGSAMSPRLRIGPCGLRGSFGARAGISPGSPVLGAAAAAKRARAGRRSKRRDDVLRLVLGERDAVAPLALHAVQRAVGAREQRGVGLPVARHRDADRDGHGEVGGGDRLAQAPSGLERLVGVGDGEQRGELVAADAEERVAAA